MLEKDIILICKGNYNKEKYKNEYEAMVAYYHKHYSGTDDDNIAPPDKRFIIHLFLKPTLFYILKDNENEIHRLFGGLGDYERIYWYFHNEYTNFYKVLFDVFIYFISTLRVKTNGSYIEKFDFSEYEQEDTIELREVI